MTKQVNVQIRRALEADVDTISAFNAALARETEARMLDLQLLRSGVETILRDRSKGWYAVAESLAEPALPIVVGQILITCEWSDWRNGHFWWLQSLYVAKPYRQQGVFRQLYQYVYEQAQTNAEKVCGFRLYVERDNHEAHEAYAHIGFQETPYQMHEIEFS
ncbi:MAG: GNAT family N-acetyltransferase [Nitrospirota bacterium]|nr:GNAT family N-acetyltransferase [Nitrospirota bacterium]MDH5587461.1 GNAT family N-acetyltransferase [Nitrospirota bacterium]MDH5774056.1 GNAT family N-acetyltransferase [Nitrospirota bacterium]